MHLFLIHNISTVLSEQCFGLYTVIMTETETLFQKAKALDLKPKLKCEKVRKTKIQYIKFLRKTLNH